MNGSGAPSARDSNLLGPVLSVMEYAELIRRALDLARAAHDRPMEAKVLWNLSLATFFAGRNDEAIRYGEASAAIARELNLREQLAYALNDLARPYFSVGRRAEGWEDESEAEALWRELGNMPMLGDNLIGTGMFYLFSGDYSTPRAKVLEGLRIGQEIGNLWVQSYANEVLGFLYAQTGELALALEHLLQAAELGARVNYLDAQYEGIVVAAMIYSFLGAAEKAIRLLENLFAKPDASPVYLTLPSAELAIILAEEGDLEGARVALERAEAGLEGSQLGFGLLILRLAQSRVLVAQNKPAVAVERSRSGLEELDVSGLRVFRSLLLYDQAMALEQLGKLEDAMHTGEAARVEAEQTSSRSWLWLILMALARIYNARGNTAAAKEMAQRARVEVRFIAEHVPDDLRASFLNRPDVGALMQGE